MPLYSLTLKLELLRAMSVVIASISCTEPYRPGAVVLSWARRITMGEGPMWQAPEFVRRIGKTLQAKDEEITREPLPERWVELIRYLDEKEREETEALERNDLPPARDSTREG
jgi:hypothetical protein